MHVKDIHEDGHVPGRALQELVFLHFVHPDHHAVRRGDDYPGLRRDIPLRVPEKIGEKTAGHHPQDRDPGPAPHQPQEDQDHPGQDKMIPRGRDASPTFAGR